MVTLTLTLALIGQFVFLAWAVFVSAKRTMRTQGFLTGIGRGALLLYGLVILGSFLFSVVIPAMLLLLGADRHVVHNSFPEEIGNMAVIAFGWFPALVVAIVVRYTCDAGGIVRGKKKLPRRPLFW